MSGHSKWAKIKRGKAVEDAKRGKVFTRHAKLIEVASRNGGDPSINPLLKQAIDNARADNVPFDNIERAIKKGTGEAKSGANIEEVIYEAFAPNGFALYIETLTDNRNRTITNLKTIINKSGGTMGEQGSVGYLFDRKGLITLLSDKNNIEEAELYSIDIGANDVAVDKDTLEVYTSPHDLMKIKTELESNGFKVESAKLIFISKTDMDVSNVEVARKLLDLIDSLEQDDDVLNVYTNANIDDDILASI